MPPQKTLNQPTNMNFLSPVGYRFYIDNLPNTNWFITATTIPGISLGEAIFPGPTMDSAVPGDTLVFGGLDVTFIVDEDMANWRELYDWMVGLTFPENYSQYKAQKAKFIYSDANMTVLDSNMNPNMKIYFKDLFPTALSDISFDSASADVDTIKGTVSFKYLNYTYEKL